MLTNTSEIEANLEVAEKNYGKVAGVGLGVFLTIMAMIFGIILCVIGTATPVFFVFMFLGILIPLITFLIVALAPLHKDQEVKKDTRTDSYVAARILFLIAMILFALLAIFKIFEYYIGINLKAKGVNSNISSISSADMIAQIPSENPPQGTNQADPSNPLNPLGSGLGPGYVPIQEDPPEYNPFASRNRPKEPTEHPLAPLRNPEGNPFLGRNPLSPK
jgi:F0F1-type ATP synthase assembly protein I